MSNDTGSAITKKQAVLDRIAVERSIWEELVAEVDPAWAIEPKAMGEWSFKDVVAHLAGWRQRFVDDVVAVVQGTPAPALEWPYTYEESEEQTPEGETRTQAINDWLFERNRLRSYEQVLAQYALQWTTLGAAVELLPDELVERRDAIARLGGESLAEALLGDDAFSHFHAEHEAEIRTWLANRRERGPST